MKFEYDPDKSASNKAKHGIDFEEAQMLWFDDAKIEIPARSDTEPRFMTIGRISG
jgi:uncharacterized DUF497 family protein